MRDMTDAPKLEWHQFAGLRANGVGLSGTNLVLVIAEQDVMQQLMPASLGEAIHMLGGRSLGGRSRPRPLKPKSAFRVRHINCCYRKANASCDTYCGKPIHAEPPFESTLQRITVDCIDQPQIDSTTAKIVAYATLIVASPTSVSDVDQPSTVNKYYTSTIL